jgi:GNAT superfamily N-acetyltransferase
MDGARTIADAAVVRRMAVEDASTVRYVHERAFKAQTAHLLTEQEVASFLLQVRSASYIETLMNTQAYVAVVNGQVVGTATWTAGDDSGAAARIGAVFVDPLFAGCGLGKRLMFAAETSARDAGYQRFSVRATANAVPFFLACGYDIASHGISSLSVVDGSMPVTFMRKTAATDARPVNARPAGHAA